MRTHIHQRLPEDVVAPFQILLREPAIPLDWPSLFGNGNPVELEVGHGKGAFLLATGVRRPDVNVVGVEISGSAHLFALQRVAKRDLAQIRLVHADAKDFLSERVAPGSLRAIHISFPDPWWKRKHHKRFVVAGSFPSLCASRLVPGGRVYLASDVPPRYLEMVSLFRAVPDLAEIDASAFDDLPEVLSNFEEKALRGGRRIARSVFERPRPPV